MSTKDQELKYYTNERGQQLEVMHDRRSAYTGPVIDIKTSTGERTVHFKIDTQGKVSLGADCGGVGDPKSGMGFGHPDSTAGGGQTAASQMGEAGECNQEGKNSMRACGGVGDPKSGMGFGHSDSTAGGRQTAASQTGEPDERNHGEKNSPGQFGWSEE